MTHNTDTERTEFPSPALLKKLQTSTEGGAILVDDYAGGYDLLTEIWRVIVADEAARRAPVVNDTRARYSGSIQELKQYASEDVDAMVHICNKHIGNVPKGFFLAMQECAALVGRAPAVPVPQGWKLVPVEPTKEMIERACIDYGFPGGSRWVYRDGYKSMLAAAPQPTESTVKQQLTVEAAPVQLPEPVAVMTDTTPREPGWKTIFVPDAGTKLYTEQQVRELLAAHGIEVAP